MKIKTKILTSILGLLVLSLVLFGSTAIYLTKVSLENEAKHSIEIQGDFLMGSLRDLNKNSEVLENAMLQGYDTSIKEHVEIVTTMLQKYYDDYEAGVYSSEEEAKTAAKEMLSVLRYGQSGYFWLDNTNYTLLVLPTAPEKVGMNRYDLQDKTGFYLMRSIIGNAVEDGDAFTEYWWNKIGTEDLFPKRSYSKYFQPWEWVTGTGNYIDEISVEVSANKDLLEKQFRENLRRSEENGMAFVFDDEGNIVYNSEETGEGESIENLFGDSELLSKISREGFVEFSTGGEDYLGYVVKDSELGYSLMVAKKTSVIYKTVRSMILTMIVILAIFMAVGIIVGMFLANKIGKPIVSITKAGNEIAEGKLNTQVPRIKTGDELEDLADTMELLVGAIRFHTKDKAKKK